MRSEPSCLDVDAGVPAPLRTVLEPVLRRALRAHPALRRLILLSGRSDREVLLALSVAGWPPLPLYLPQTVALDPEAVVRILDNVLVGMGVVRIHNIPLPLRGEG
jgi:hypothetical protein